MAALPPSYQMALQSNCADHKRSSEECREERTISLHNLLKRAARCVSNCSANSPSPYFVVLLVGLGVMGSRVFPLCVLVFQCSLSTFTGPTCTSHMIISLSPSLPLSLGAIRREKRSNRCLSSRESVDNPIRKRPPHVSNKMEGRSSAPNWGRAVQVDWRPLGELRLFTPFGRDPVCASVAQHAQRARARVGVYVFCVSPRNGRTSGPWWQPSFFPTHRVRESEYLACEYPFMLSLPLDSCKTAAFAG